MRPSRWNRSRRAAFGGFLPSRGPRLCLQQSQGQSVALGTAVKPFPALLFHLERDLRPSADQQDKAQKLASMVRSVCEQLDGETHCYGSCSNGTFMQGSDVDLTWLCDQNKVAKRGLVSQELRAPTDAKPGPGNAASSGLRKAAPAQQMLLELEALVPPPPPNAVQLPPTPSALEHQALIPPTRARRRPSPPKPRPASAPSTPETTTVAAQPESEPFPAPPEETSDPEASPEVSESRAQAQDLQPLSGLSGLPMPPPPPVVAVSPPEEPRDSISARLVQFRALRLLRAKAERFTFEGVEPFACIQVGFPLGLVIMIECLPAQVVRLLKHWARRRQLGDRAKGGFSTYTLVLMAVKVLQESKACKLPAHSVQELVLKVQEDSSPEPLQIWMQAKKDKLCTPKMLEKTFVAFFDYFAQPAWSSGGIVRVAPAAASEQDKESDCSPQAPPPPPLEVLRVVCPLTQIDVQRSKAQEWQHMAKEISRASQILRNLQLDSQLRLDELFKEPQEPPSAPESPPESTPEPVDVLPGRITEEDAEEGAAADSTESVMQYGAADSFREGKAQNGSNCQAMASAAVRVTGKDVVTEQDLCSTDSGTSSLDSVKKLPAERVNINRGKPGSELAMHQRSISRDSEDPLAEIGVFSLLRQSENAPQYLLEMLSAFQVSEEIWLVLENADGGDLFGVVSSRRMSTGQIMLWAWQLLQAVKFLHLHGISHRDISLENVLLSGGDVRLMDFGQAVQTHLETGELCRYFVPAGKPYYRPPEAYIPNQGTLAVISPASSRAGQVALALTSAQDFLCHVRLLEAAEPGQLCAAEPWGYTAPPIDIFACAVCITIMFLAGPPWRQARPTDKYFQWVQSNGLGALATSWKKAVPSSASELLGQMMQTDPERRPAIEGCLAHAWFGPLRSAPVALRDSTGFGKASPASPRLAGDCYREQEWVCRSLPSLSVAPEVLEACASSVGPEFDVLGDPYRDIQPWSAELHLPTQADAEIAGLLCDAPPPLPLVREDRTEIRKIEAEVGRVLQVASASPGKADCRPADVADDQDMPRSSAMETKLASAMPSLPPLGRSRSEASASPRCLAGSPAQALRALRKTSSGAPESSSDHKYNGGDVR
ncbi:SMU1 [Symbiodinium necroappetens]|uniref:SMU1 protein n=1 Tax=Symbiodinium necroappetens TaxID=1628268 RepID=A0A812W378_9DINO|nr:SMU1 [Symbiodinium necroappetens]